MIYLEKIKKEDVIKLMGDLKAKGYTQAELAVMLDKSPQSIWCYSSITQPKRIPTKMDFLALKQLLDNPK